MIQMETTSEKTYETEFFTDILAAIDDAGKESEILPEKQPENVTERLNAMIAAGISFKVSSDDFQTCGADSLSESEKEFLTVNKISILCTLQYGLLVKHLFSRSPELRQTFVAKVEEGGADFEAARETTAKWFARLLDTISDPATT